MIPFDETLTRVSVDVSTRPSLVWRVNFSRPKLGEMDTELFKEWFQAFAQSAGVTLHIENLYGENNHHIVESCFKGLARALRQAVEIDPRRAGAVPSRPIVDVDIKLRRDCRRRRARSAPQPSP